MRALIIFFISIFAIFLLLAFFSLLLPSQVTVTKSVLIKAPKEKIREQIGHFTNWQNWFPPLQNKSVSMNNKSENSVLLKDSSGRQILLTMNKSGSDTILVSFESVSSSNIVYEFLLKSRNADSTQVILNVNTTLKWYPWQKLKGVFLDKITGPMYEETLGNLKSVAEPHPDPSPRVEREAVPKELP